MNIFILILIILIGEEINENKSFIIKLLVSFKKEINSF